MQGIVSANILSAALSDMRHSAINMKSFLLQAKDFLMDCMFSVLPVRLLSLVVPIPLQVCSHSSLRPTTIMPTSISLLHHSVLTSLLPSTRTTALRCSLLFQVAGLFPTSLLWLMSNG